MIKDDRGPEGGRTKYLLTSDLSLTTQQVVQWYRRRWAVEVFFRDAKQHLGLGGCEARRPELIISHVVLVCVAYTLLQLLKPSSAVPRPSVCAIKDDLAPLVMLVLPLGELMAQRPLPDGSLEEIDLEHFFQPVRTRLPHLAVAHDLVFT